MGKFFKFAAIFFIFLFFLIGISIGLLAFYHPQKVITFLTSLHPTPTLTPHQITGIGVLGDSLSDEYRADDRRGLTYASTTLNWVEILAEKRKLNFGEWRLYEEPRRQGFAYNFSRTGSSVSWAIEIGQHTGLQKEIRQGNVNTVIIALGVNDFAPLAQEEGYEAIYNGTMTDDQIRRKINRLTADMKTIVETLHVANPNVRILMVMIPSWARSTIVQIAFPIPENRRRVIEAIERANGELKKLAEEKKIAIADLSEFDQDIEQRIKNDNIVIGKVSLNKFIPGDDPRNLYLTDGVHPGTIYNGLMANFVIANLNQQIGTSIKPLSDEEILEAAGL